MSVICGRAENICSFRLFNRRDNAQETLGLVLRAKAHDPFDPGAIVPAAVEDYR
jgi:hypothetical protein